MKKNNILDISKRILNKDVSWFVECYEIAKKITDLPPERKKPLVRELKRMVAENKKKRFDNVVLLQKIRDDKESESKKK